MITTDRTSAALATLVHVFSGFGTWREDARRNAKIGGNNSWAGRVVEGVGSFMTVGDKASTGFTELYLAERVPMLRVAVLMLGSSQQAEEVVQDAFVSVGNRWDEIDRPGGYLRTTVINGCRGVLRRRDVEDRYLEASITDARQEVTLPGHLVELHEALGRLNERQRTVVVLRYFVDVADAEIAEIMGISPVTVRTLTHRSLSILREELS